MRVVDKLGFQFLEFPGKLGLQIDPGIENILAILNPFAKL
jgi:hypothetical protein